MAEKNRASVLAIVKETTAGTPVSPSVGTNYIALQEGFTFEPNFEQLENAEIRASIGASKTIQGLEVPNGSYDHYLRASGVEGQAPSYGPLLESALGSVSTNGSERTTAAASTVSLIKLTAGGSDFPRGKAMLIKDGTNGFNVRNTMGFSGNDVTLAFELPTAPASGINTGLCVNYAVADTGHATLTQWLYRGNGGALEVIAGSQVTEFSISVAAGELINASFTFEGTSYYYDPIEIGATDVSLDFTDDDGTFAATIPADLYRDPHSLAQAIEDAMNTANPLQTHTVEYIDSGANKGKFHIYSTGTVLSLLWNSGGNAANTIGDKIGFLTAADDTGTAATTGYFSDNSVSFANSITPSYDSADPQAAKNNEVLIGDSDDTVCFCASTIDISLTNEVQNVECVCAESGVQEKLILRRVVEANIVGILERYDADKFRKFRENTEIKMAYTFGSKSGGNWVAGTVCNVFIPSGTISSHVLGDNNGLATMEITVRAFVDNTGAGEFFINFL